jgi:hypothetical protein
MHPPHGARDVLQIARDELEEGQPVLEEDIPSGPVTAVPVVLGVVDPAVLADDTDNGIKEIGNAEETAVQVEHGLVAARLREPASCFTRVA